MPNFDITPYVHMHPKQVRELIRDPARPVGRGF